MQRPDPIPVPPGDTRFADPAYHENPAYFLPAQQYLWASQLADDILDLAGLSGSTGAKARFAMRFLLDALAPTNTLHRPRTCTRYHCSFARRGSTSTTSWTSRPVRASSSGLSNTVTPALPSATATRTPR
ncbi:MAG: hypothetical protein JXO22_01795 [Phycisphaerae bacterium]|nr:hypothetical protein [Phycisphaerae bacterium]